LGNGTLQDILYNAKVHPKRKMDSVTEEETKTLFRSIRYTLSEMAKLGGRDTEKDLFGEPGGYETRCSKNTAGKPCQVCGSEITKASYMGGSIYFCPGCQSLG
jgi:formamidopyrimidine-DNA glycosylase